MTGNHFLAEKSKTVGSSGIRKVFDLAASMVDPIDLSIGQPDFKVPQPIKDAAIRAIRNDRNGYTLTHGLPELRERIVQTLHDGLNGVAHLGIVFQFMQDPLRGLPVQRSWLFLDRKQSAHLGGDGHLPGQ